jgi:pyruvate,water dikinase
VVGTAAYRLVADRLEINELVVALEATTDQRERARLAGSIRKLLTEAPVPAELVAAIAEAYDKLGARLGAAAAPVAVRSSATAEDLPFASFAGQQDTFLNVVGTDAVGDAVRRSWASLWTDRAVSYRANNRIDHRVVSLAVVVQGMIDSAVAGVLFTANPITGTRDEAVVDASPGLGEAVVSGAVDPDHFVLDAAGTVRQRRLGTKQLVIRPAPGGGTSTTASADTDAAASIADGQLRRLAALGRRVAAHYGAPQDIEWALDGDGTLWLTQTRPITTLFPVPEAVRPGLRVYLSANVAQGVNQPFTPMGLAGLRAVAGSIPRSAGFRIEDPLDGPPALVEAADRLFIDLTAPIRSTFGREVVPRLLNVMEARSSVIFTELTGDPRLTVTDRSRWRGLRALLRAALHVRAPVWIAEALVRPDAARRRSYRRAAEVERLTRPPGDADSATARIDEAVRVLTEVAGPRVTRFLPVVGTAFALIGGVAPRVLGAAGGEPELRVVQRGVPFNVTTEMDLELGRLARAIRADSDAAALRGTPTDELTGAFRAGTLPALVRRGVADFLERYGHRAVAEIDLGLPRWSDDPTHVFGVLVNYLRVQDESWDPVARFAQGAAEAEAMVAELVARTRQRYGSARGWLLGKILGRYRALAGVRELPKFCLVLILARARTQLGELGELLAAAGRLDGPEDVFFLDLREARAAAGALDAGADGVDLRALVRRRRADYERELLRRHVPRMLLSDGTEPEAALAAAAPTDPNALTGTAASAGSVTGPARVVLDPVGAHLAPGDILVAPSTDPGWTPLFLTAGGLVMEMGGPNSHGAVVAREYGIPAVVGVPDATTRIGTGRRITVNGAAGTVELLDTDA